ncbi:MAG TPA: DUF535 family protein [Paucimonas sp.]|nr:DUF535 family protein [Paucimonas sp.]
MLIGYLLHPLQTRKWLRYIERTPALLDMARASPHLRGRLRRPYLTPRLSYADRVDLLIGHYDILLHSPLADWACKAAQQPVPLGEFIGKSGAVYQLTLAATDAARRDGELVLRLMSRDVCVYTAAFVFLRQDGERCVKLGGLQGLLATDKTMGIKQVTRDLYGCRPKELMVAVVREIGRLAGCGKLILIGNANKLPPREKHVCRKSADYDATWEEMRALRRPDGDYELPCRAGGSPGAFEAGASRRTVVIESLLDLVRLRFSQDRVTAAVRTASHAPPMPAPPAVPRGTDIDNRTS